jgi:hypothetical protein
MKLSMGVEIMAAANIPVFLSANKMKGEKVTNMNGDELGKIEDVMIDQDKGKIAYVVIKFGGFLGIGDKEFAIPWEALTGGQGGSPFTLKINKEILEKAEGFDTGKLPSTREQLSKTYTYYGNKPYWETGGQEETETERLDRMERERSRQAETPEKRI